MKHLFTFFTATMLAVVIGAPAHAQTNYWKELRALPFNENYPTKKAADRLYDEMLFHRATQVVLWSLPAMTLWAMKKGSAAQFGEGSNVFPIWKDRLTAETLVSTPNSDVIYGMGYLDLKKDGPTVIEVPPKLQGILDDFWHRPLTDVGYVGPDKGKGGKYLILPPDFKGKAPDGYYPFKSPTYNVFVFWRAFRDKKTGDTKEAVALMEKTRIYPLSKKDNPPKMVFPNGTGQPANMLYPKDYRYFEGLADFVQHEYVGPEDWSMRGLMASLGIVKGKPFKPDPKMREILSAGAEVGMKMAHALRFGDKLPGTLYYKDRQWNNVLNVPDVEFKEDSYTNIDARVGMFIIGYSISPAMVMNMVGKGSKYPFAYRDAAGDYLSGGSMYRLHIPPNVPAANFWSVTLYDAENASGLKNGQPFPSVGSLDKLKYNDDGSVDLYFGPKLPKGAPKSNWLKTVPGKGWFTLFRLYSPTKPFFDQTWRPGDFEKITRSAE
ncbi:DUF1254 domain-containing protein [Thermodesulfobacteriota bacterium]